MKTLRDSFAIGCHVKRDGFACLDEGQRVAGVAVRERGELRPLLGRTLMPSILDKAFKGEL